MKFVCLVIACVLPLQAWANDNLKAVVESNAVFSDKLMKVLSSDQNLVCSPLSLQLVLGMARLGAVGRTAEDLTKSLNFPAEQRVVKDGFKLLLDTLKEGSGSNFQLDIASRMYVSSRAAQDLNPTFKSESSSVFGSTANVIDFSSPQAVSDINKWVAKKTSQKIKNLVQPGSLDQSTQILLVNAVYFKGSWVDPFDATLTTPGDFNPAPNTPPINMQFMHREADFKYATFPRLNADALVLPYRGGKLSLMIILPKNPLATLKSLEELMVEEDYDIQYMATRAKSTEVEVTLPKFKLEVALNLNGPLQQLGLEQIFGPNANFSGIANSNPPLRISTVAQKTFIEISEEGTEAAASTYVDAVDLAIKNTPVFKANRPFLFYLLHRTTPTHQTVIFSGRFFRPQQ